MRAKKICIYGGTDLQGTPTEFVAAAAYAVLSDHQTKIITGGFKHSNDKRDAISTDVAALHGATRYATEHGIPLSDCYEAWIPDAGMDERPDVQGAIRLSEADGVKIRELRGRTPLGRRLAMVNGVDMVITVAGRRHTETVAEQALEVGVPILPIPDAGGDSLKVLKNYRNEIAARFPAGHLEACLDTVTQYINSDSSRAASAVADLVQNAKIGKCLVLMPYDPEHDEIYESIVKPTITKHMFSVRLDHLPTSQSIYTSFEDEMSRCTAVIADITKLNENVMYEIGYAHGRGLRPLIYSRNTKRIDNLPIYFRTLRIPVVDAGNNIADQIDHYLEHLKSSR